MARRTRTQKRARTRGAVAAVLLTGTVGMLSTAPAAHAEDSGTAGDVLSLTADGHFVPASAGGKPKALSYDPKLVPPGGWIQIQQKADPKGTTVTLKVKGLAAHHAYGVHVHQKPCGADPEAAGAHYQHVKDPKLVNRDNEVWLDFRSDQSGSAQAGAHHEWGLPKGAAGSVVLHREQGGAGDRVGCFTVPFGDFATGMS